MIDFIFGVRSELTKVTWPSREDVIRLTTTVVIISAFVGVYLGAADYIFLNLLGILVK